ncbi:hypothetical protein [Streptomyces sp. NRRL B-1347]|uniref:hypothetical protein n=1 Tax=Streptomyces sp. NRRL B-1347 TaxID=1476877 RepID=UPI00068C487C|nr:hypothetical protein [Streptomyces sp. NRRL B-1347]
MDDEYLPRNPRGALGLTPVDAKRIFVIRKTMAESYQAMVALGGGCGLRQGEVLGVAVDVIDFEADMPHALEAAEAESE